jgi:hypothetical protein
MPLLIPCSESAFNETGRCRVHTTGNGGECVNLTLPANNRELKITRQKRGVENEALRGRQQRDDLELVLEERADRMKRSVAEACTDVGRPRRVPASIASILDVFPTQWSIAARHNLLENI